MERKLARMAGAAHGVVTRRQLLAAGVSRAQIAWRLDIGALHREYPGVYRVGHRAASFEAGYLSATLACGDGALLSGRAAAHLLGLVRSAPPGPEVITTVRRRVEGVRTRRTRRRDGMRWRGIPVTTVARTLVDLAAVLPPDELARACHEAGVRHRTTPADVEAVLARYPNAPGAAWLRRVLRGDVHVTLSRLESGFLEQLGEAELPLPLTNRPAGGRRVDCRWPEHALTVELDSYRFHHSRHAWERDEFRRYTYSDGLEQPKLMLRELRALLLGE